MCLAVERTSFLISFNLAALSDFQLLSLYSGCEVLGYVKSVQDVGTEDVDLETFTREQVSREIMLLLVGTGTMLRSNDLRCASTFDRW